MHGLKIEIYPKGYISELPASLYKVIQIKNHLPKIFNIIWIDEHTIDIIKI